MKKPAFLSKQVDQAAYYYLNLTATGNERLTLVCGGRELCRPDYVMERRTFRYRSIEFVAEGLGDLHMAGTTCALAPGMAFSYGPGIPHRIRTDPDEPMTKYFVDFTGTDADALVAATALRRGPVQVSEPARIRAVFDDLQRHADRSEPRADDICLLLLRLLLLKIDALVTPAPGRHPRALQSYERCKRCLDEHFLTLASLADLARTCHMDAATICRLFKRFGEMTPYQYLLRRKMHYAADRLQASDLLIKELSDDLGFSDPFHFSRTFKRVHGISPQRFLELGERKGSERKGVRRECR